MKFLAHYMNDLVNEALEQFGGFFAFSDTQLAKHKRDKGLPDDVELVSLGAGLICPKPNAAQLLQALDRGHRLAVARDLAENGREAIIARELANYECDYTGDISDCVEALKGYGITADEIRKVWISREVA
jgi:hypothetical protein